MTRRPPDSKAWLADLEGSAPELEDHRKVAALLAEAPSGGDRDLVPGIHARLRQAPPKRPRRIVWGFVGAAAALLIVTPLVVVQPKPDAFEPPRAKSAAPAQSPRWHGVRAYRFESSEAPVPAEGWIRSQDKLLFTYTNLRPASHLMIFAVDAAGDVYWYHPAYTDAQSDPTSIPIAPKTSKVELRDSIEHALKPGRIALYGVFSDRPLTVSEIEREVKGLVSRREWIIGKRPELRLGGVVAQHITPLDVTP